MSLYRKLFRFLRDHPGPTIVYVTLQKQTELLADDLREQGFSAMPFHAGMPTAEKTRMQNNFMGRNDLIVVATIAFGMVGTPCTHRYSIFMGLNDLQDMLLHRVETC